MLWTVAIIACVLGLATGLAIGFLLASRKHHARLATASTDLALAQQREHSATAQLHATSSTLDSLRSQLTQRDTESARLQERVDAANRNLADQRKLLDDAYQQLKQAFAAVSQDVLAKNNEAFLDLARQRFETLQKEATGDLDQRKTQIESLLKPMQELLNHYQVRVGEIEKSRTESYSMLREQLGTLAETQRTLNLQTNQLVSALRRPQTRGQWGEITLRRLVELAGMSQRCDFEEQTSVDGEDGRQRPDMVVRLPGDRSIVIDSKAALDAFLDAAAAPDEDNRKLCLQRHRDQVRSRARELSAKAYWSQFRQSPEYVVMFLPGEAFLYAAVEQDGSLIEDCLKTKVIIATPTTLMALLKVIEFGWRQEEIADNADAIRKHGKDLYDRIATLVSHFDKLGNSIDQVVTNYNNTLSSMESRVFVTARKIGELGARSDKDVPELDLRDIRPRELSAALREIPESSDH